LRREDIHNGKQLGSEATKMALLMFVVNSWMFLFLLKELVIN